MTWADSLAPLRVANFRWYFAARVVNLAGGMMAGVALAFAVLDLTGSASALGQVLAARTIPLVVFLLAGGVIADRLPRTLVVQASALLSGLTQAAVATLLLTGNAELWMLICLEAVNGLAFAVSMPAISGLMPQLVPRELLQPSNALMSLSRGSMTILGPSVGALLVVTVGSGWALAVDAATFFASAAFMTRVRIPPRAPRAQETGAIADLRAGWALFRSTTWLWVVVLAFGFLNAINTGSLQTLGPEVANHTFGKQGWGLALSMESVGLLAMTFVLLRVRLRRPLLYGMLGCTLMALPITLLGTNPELGFLLPAFFLCGAGMEVFSMGWTLAMQENIEESMMSRAWAYDSLGSFVAMPIGQLAYGPLGETFGYRDVLVISGIAYAAISLITLASRSVRDLPRTPVTIPSELSAPR